MQGSKLWNEAFAPVAQFVAGRFFERDTKRYKVFHVEGERLRKWLHAMPGILVQEGVLSESKRGQSIQ